ncbi:hypothetical protein [Chitinophaga rhizophila]|nr:hypothetical protein [Chitinophaga rhizophila]
MKIKAETGHILKECRGKAEINEIAGGGQGEAATKGGVLFYRYLLRGGV